MLQSSDKLQSSSCVGNLWLFMYGKPELQTVQLILVFPSSSSISDDNLVSDLRMMLSELHKKLYGECSGCPCTAS